MLQQYTYSWDNNIYDVLTWAMINRLDYDETCSLMHSNSHEFNGSIAAILQYLHDLENNNMVMCDLKITPSQNKSD